MIQFYNYIKRTPFFIYFTIYLRYLLGGVFVYATLWKLEMLDVDPALFKETELTPAYAFQAIIRIRLLFEAVLLFQFISGALLLTQRFATLGAILYFPVILSICLITISIGFQGTQLITSLMVLANLYLLCWDFDKFRALFFNNGHFTVSNHKLFTLKYWIWNGLILFVIALLFMLHQNVLIWLASSFIWGLIGFLYFIFSKKRFIVE